MREQYQKTGLLTFRQIAEELKIKEKQASYIFYTAIKKLRKNGTLPLLLALAASKDYVDLNWHERRSWNARRNRCRSRKI